jgi:carbamoyltransferase
MLYVTPVRPAQAARIPATTHVDGSARLQTVFEAWSPLYHRLIQRFGKATGVPVLLNTSFNLKGEPVVASPADAHRTYVASGLDALVMGPFITCKEGLG